MKKLEGKIALITGAGSGMGKATAMLFAREGAKIAAVDIDEKAADETASEIERGGGRAIAIRADVSIEEDASRMVERTMRQLGTPGVAFNNAGIEGESALIGKMTCEAFDRVIAINLRGVFLGMKYVLPPMVEAGGGSIINQASIAGMVAVRGGAAYCAAKAGVIAMTRVAALEYAKIGRAHV